MQRKVNVVEDLDGYKIVFIHDIVFKGKRSVEWSDVEAYLKRFVGEEHIVRIPEIWFILAQTFRMNIRIRIIRCFLEVQMQKRKPMQHKESQRCC